MSEVPEHLEESVSSPTTDDDDDMPILEEVEDDDDELPPLDVDEELPPLEQTAAEDDYEILYAWLAKIDEKNSSHLKRYISFMLDLGFDLAKIRTLKDFSGLSEAYLKEDSQKLIKKAVEEEQGKTAPPKEQPPKPQIQKPTPKAIKRLKPRVDVNASSTVRTSGTPTHEHKEKPARSHKKTRSELPANFVLNSQGLKADDSSSDGSMDSDDEMTPLQRFQRLTRRRDRSNSEPGPAPIGAKLKMYQQFGGVASAANNCKLCKKRAYPLESISVDGQMFHRQCFKCTHCKQRLSIKGFAMYHGKGYCKPHFKQLFKEKGGRYDAAFLSPVADHAPKQDFGIKSKADEPKVSTLKKDEVKAPSKEDGNIMIHAMATPHKGNRMRATSEDMNHFSPRKPTKKAAGFGLLNRLNSGH